MGKKGILFVVEDNPFSCKIPSVFLANIIKKHMPHSNILVISPIDKNSNTYLKNLDLKIYSYPHFESKKFFGYFLEYSISCIFSFTYFLFLLFTQSFNVVLFTLQPSYYFVFVILCKIFKKKILIDIWDFGDELFVARFGKNFLFEGILRKLDSFMIQYSDFLFVHNKFQTRKVEYEFKRNNGIIEYNGIVDIEIAKATPIISPLSNLPKNTGLVMVLNRSMVTIADGALEFCKVAKKFYEKHKEKDVIFIQTGKGNIEQVVKKFIKENNLEDRFIFTGFISLYEELLQLIKISDICVGMDVNIRYNYKIYSAKYIEYSWAGKPIVAWKLPVLKEYLDGYVYFVRNGDIEEMADTIYRFSIDPLLRERYSKLSRAAYDKLFSEKVQKNAIISAFEKVLKL